MTKKILLTNHWASNLGDIAILERTINQIEELNMDLEITIESSHPEITKKYFPKYKIVTRVFDLGNVKHSKSIYSLSFFAQNFKFILNTIYNGISLLMLPIININKRPIFECYKSNDIILLLGGDYISKNYAYFFRLFEITIANKLGKPIILYAHSIGPFHKSMSGFCTYALNLPSKIISRDSKTTKILKELSVTQNVIQNADTVISLKQNPSKKAKEYSNNISKKTIGIVLRDFKYAEFNDDDYSKYLTGMYKIYEHIVNTGNDVSFITPNEADLSITKQFIQGHNLKDATILDTSLFLPSENKYIFSNLTLLISARMHPIILATGAGVPVIGVGREFKMINYLSLIELEQYFLDMIPFDSKKGIALINESLSKNDEIRTLIKKTIQPLREKSNSNILVLKELINE